MYYNNFINDLISETREERFDVSDKLYLSSFDGEELNYEI